MDKKTLRRASVQMACWEFLTETTGLGGDSSVGAHSLPRGGVNGVARIQQES